ncbi:response regulator [Telmatospirillum siberiense]|uniref:Two-component system response regulator n=1 Tax=Telmatospirillum siberiense TaxID=382514 RepID=A0A2N3PS19_9PROT|nr:response regulator [Telmatospirillum siberiense]PKU23176.1 two-component system response regulator [Telmatospirillum siberiense]
MSKTILIVEDNDLNLKLFNDLLQTNGYLTVVGKDGKSAVEMARETHPDLILMDIQLRRFSALEATRLLKGDPALHAIPVVAVTASAMKGDEERIRQGGCDGYIAKPISVSSFLKTVAGFVA